MNSEKTLGKISFVVPVYNSEAYIARCLDSILNQSYENVEAVCIDDGSSDGSAAILDDYLRRYPTKMIVEHRVNAGAAAARNRGIELSTGDYLTFVDNDDWLDADFAQALVGAAQKDDAEVVCSGYRRPNSEGKVILEAVPSPSDEWGPYVVEAAWAKLYRLDYVRRNGFMFLDTNIDEDLYFSLPAVELAERLVILPYCGYNWFYNEGSVSNTSQRSSKGLRFEETLDAILAMLGEKGIPVTPILQHYFVRLVTWFVLYTRKGDGAKRAQANLEHYRNWLDKNVFDWRKESFASPGHPTGDLLANRLAVWLFVRHPHVFSMALTMYGKVA